MMLMELLLVLVAAALCVSRLSTFLYHQPILTQISSHTFHTSMFPAVTLCQWPPFNLSHLLEAAGHPPLPDNFHLLNSEEQQQLVLKTLEHLSKNSSQSLVAAWQSAQWDIKDTVRAYYSVSGTRIYPQWETYQSTSLGSCYIMTYNSTNSFVKKIVLRIIMPEFTSNIRVGNFLYVAIHGRDNNPPFIHRPFIDQSINYYSARYFIKSIVDYHSMNPEDESYGNCVQDCLEAEVRKNLSLASPVFNNKDLYPHNDAQVERLLAAQWQSIFLPNRFYTNFMSEDKKTKCFFDCRSQQQQFYKVSGAFRDLYSSAGFTSWAKFPNSLKGENEKKVEVVMDNKLQERVQEYVGYTLPQLLSDVGGVVGVATGASLLSVLLFVLSKTMKLWQTEE